MSIHSEVIQIMEQTLDQGSVSFLRTLLDAILNDIITFCSLFYVISIFVVLSDKTLCVSGKPLCFVWQNIMFCLTKHYVLSDDVSIS